MPHLERWYNLLIAAGFDSSDAQKYGQLFREQEVKVSMILNLTHEALLKMGVTKANHRIKILRMADVYQLEKEEANGKNPPADAVSECLQAEETTGDKRNSDHSRRSGQRTDRAPLQASSSQPIELLYSGGNSPNTTQKTGALKRTIKHTSLDVKGSPLIKDQVSPRTHSITSGRDVASKDTIDRSDAYPSSDSSDRCPPPLEKSWQPGDVFSDTKGLDECDLQNLSLSSDDDLYYTLLRSLPASERESVSNTGAQLLEEKSKEGAEAPPSDQMELKYYVENDLKMKTVKTKANMQSFVSGILAQNENLSSDITIFSFDNKTNKLKVIKEYSPIVNDEIYYVVENSKLNHVSKLEKKAKKGQFGASGEKITNQVYTSDNNPLQVDFLPDDELYMNQTGRLGLCMCIGRKKRKLHHEWDRDMTKDLKRLKTFFHCDVLVSLIRQNEMNLLKIPNLIEEVENLGIESIHFPILDKWIPDSMTRVIELVCVLVSRLRSGKSVIIHCNGGKGRSGTIAVACLVAMGKKVSSAIEAVRKARPGTIRNPLQIIFVKRFKRAYKAYVKKASLTRHVKHAIEEDEASSSEHEAAPSSLQENQELRHVADASEDKKGKKADEKAAKKPSSKPAKKPTKLAQGPKGGLDRKSDQNHGSSKNG
ncbi:uncharacterized protein LOC126319967 [Schistocerca gregaria]|uniref:uncharacterized protein LOC126319967 n=1 Tax=Schistocerca gregaria TaxID=7010 RepID=UPI00211E85B5|nr:uncharacterized protein LOC126319967 [Schistocerca gregaria]